MRQPHIHFGQRSVNGGISIWLCQTSFNVSPVAATQYAEILAAIRAGVAYVNVHSSKYLGGEIRGQLRGDDD